MITLNNWSDEARRAALENRRARKKEKKHRGQLSDDIRSLMLKLLANYPAKFRESEMARTEAQVAKPKKSDSAWLLY